MQLKKNPQGFFFLHKLHSNMHVHDFTKIKNDMMEDSKRN